MNRFFNELRRRNVFRVAGVYAVVGWLIAQIATTLEESLGLPVWFDGVIVAILLLGFPLALIFAWAFELTPDGIVKTEQVSVDESITARTGRKLDIAIDVGLVLLGTYLGWQQLREPPPARSEVTEVTANPGLGAANTIAVLAFDDLSPAGDQEYFSDGIAEEILNVLVRVQGLDVTSRTSAFQFKGRGLGIPEIARELQVRHIVEGSVRKAGENVRVTAQLIDTTADSHLWSDTFDRPLSAEDVFIIQDEIAHAIVKALRETMGLEVEDDVAAPALTDNLTAYELFLKARRLVQARARMDEADALIERALELDPGFAMAWELKAVLQPLLRAYGYNDLPFASVETTTVEYANRALELDPMRAAALGAILLARLNQHNNSDIKYDIQGLLDLGDRALAIDPANADVRNWRGLLHASVGNLEPAVADFEACIDSDPYYTPCAENLTHALAAMGRDAESFEVYLDALGRGSHKLKFAPFLLLARLGEKVAFMSAANDPEFLSGWRRIDELYDAMRNLDQDHSNLVRDLQRFAPDTGKAAEASPVRMIVVPLGAYDVEPTAFALWDEGLSDYRQSRQFREYIIRQRILAHWQQHGFPPQCRPIGDDDFECP